MKNKIKYGEIYYYDFGEHKDSRQSGMRPALVIQDDRLNSNSSTTIVAAITTTGKKEDLLSHVILNCNFGLKRPSMVMFEQITSVNQSDLLEYIGKVDSDYILRKIKESIRKTFGLWDYSVRYSKRVSLCSEHLKESMKNKDTVISRIHPFDKIKYKCSKCQSLGYKYLIMGKGDNN